ncbi:MAG: transposase, partial [Prevotella sp.]|nr:transposase [Prevotella sp.]
IWSFLAVNLGLVYFFYCRGSRASEVFFEFIRGFTGAFQSDGYRTYKSAGKWFLRLACFQHVKRKFLDCGDDFDCKVIVRLINYIYHLDHKHRIGHAAIALTPFGREIGGIKKEREE